MPTFPDAGQKNECKFCFVSVQLLKLTQIQTIAFQDDAFWFGKIKINNQYGKLFDDFKILLNILEIFYTKLV